MGRIRRYGSATNEPATPTAQQPVIAGIASRTIFK
jgi:hypothetical protein